MRPFNFIAFLGLYLVISPQAIGQQQYMQTLKAIETTIKTPQYTQHVYKKHPYSKEIILSDKKSFSSYFNIKTFKNGYNVLKPIVIDIKKHIRPKILEEEA